MKKGARKMHRVNCIKFIIIAVLVQILILTVYLVPLFKTLPPPIEEAKHITVLVDKFEIGEHWANRHKNSNYIIYANSTQYRIRKDGILVSLGKDSIKPGDKLSLIYFEDQGVFRNKNFAIDVRSESEVFVSSQEYYDTLPKTIAGWSGIIGFFELIFIGIVVMYFIEHKNDFKTLFVNSKRKKAKQKSDSQ